MGKTYNVNKKALVELTAITAATVTDDTKWYVEIGYIDDANKESKIIPIDELSSLIDTVLDLNAIHKNIAAEISTVTEKGTPIDADLILIEDSADSNNKKRIQIGNITLTDSDAIHDNIASEISAITEKATPISADLLIIEDSADSNNKKRVQIGNLPGGSGGTEIEDTAATTGLYTEETANRIVGHSSGTGTSLIFEMFEGTGTPVSVFQIDGNGIIYNNNIATVNIDNSKYNYILGGDTNTTGQRNVAIGGLNLINAVSHSDNIVLGYEAFKSASIGTNGNVVIGRSALENNSTGIDYSVYIGFNSGSLGGGSYSVGLGYSSLGTNTGTNITAVGRQAGYTGNGNNTVFLGAFAGYYSTESDILLIHNSQLADAATEKTNSLIVGEFNATKASQWLQVNGKLRTYGRRSNEHAITSLYTLTELDEVLYVDSSGGSFTISLPAITATNSGTRHIIKIVDGTSVITLTTNGTDTIEGGSSPLAINSYSCVEIIANNTDSKWYFLRQW